MSKLYVIATPIGNLGDITHRAITVLGRVDALACEDTRRTRILLEHYDIPRPDSLFSCHEHNESRVCRRIIELLERGRTVGLCTNAGMPLISDPGYRTVSTAVEVGFEITVIPGPSAVQAALVASGLPCSSYIFKGFPPRKKGKQRRFLAAEKELPHTLVFYESPYRTAKLLRHALEVLGDRRAAVCLELTKKFERVHHGFLSDLSEEFSGERIRGEVTVVVAGKHPKFIRTDGPDSRDEGS